MKFELDSQWRSALDDVGLKELANERAQEVAQIGRSTAPRQTGAYSRGFRTIDAAGEDHKAYVINVDRDANLVEFGWGPTPAYRTMTNATVRANLRFEPR